MKVILVFSLLFGVAWSDLSCECGKRNAGRIVGGKETKKNEYPWMVALQGKDNTFTYGGGTVITPWHVLTAGHCVDGKQASEVVLVVGAHDVNDLSDPTAQRLNVDQIIVHPYYNTTTYVADLALLVTSTEIIFNDNVGPACMPRGGLGDEMVGEMVKITGWGRYDPTKPNTDKIKKLREADLEVVSVTDCELLNRRKICTYAMRKGTCMGDSGGPAVWLDPETNRYTLVGIVSTAPRDCAPSTLSSTNTSVSFYIDWINMMISYSKNQVKTCRKV